MPILQLSGTDIDGDRIVCTGSQIASVLSLLSEEAALAGCDWYAGAIDNFGPGIAPYQEHEPFRVPDFGQFVETIRSAPQLLDGIFVAMRVGEKPVLLHPIFTADGPMENAVGNCIIELHAFDTSWVELYSADTGLMRRMADRFPGAKWHD